MKNNPTISVPSCVETVLLHGSKPVFTGLCRTVILARFLYVTERTRAAPISKVERHIYQISVRSIQASTKTNWYSMNIALKINRFRWDCPFSGQYIQVVARFLVMRLEIGAERVATNVKKMAGDTFPLNSPIIKKY